MTIEIAMSISGFLFLLILVLNIPMAVFGNKLGWSEDDSGAKLQKISDDPKKLQIGIVFGLIEHVSVIALAILLFIAFGPFSIILGIVWTISRIGEGLFHISNEINYSGLIKLARQYSDTSGADKKSLSDLARAILQTKDSRFAWAIILWSIGTLAFSIVLVTYEVVPSIIGWLGIVAGIVAFFVNQKKLVKPNYVIPNFIALLSLSPIIFEVSIGVWLLFY